MITDPIESIDLGFLRQTEQDDEIGRLGGYRVLQVLGVGAMGIVFRAEDPRLSRFVALKVMKLTGPENDKAKQRFLREAQSAGCLEHDNVVTIYQVGEDDGVPFIAMQLLEGESLQDQLDREGQLSQSRVCEIGRQVAEGLSAAHQQGLIHRDIKPDNIWIENNSGRLKILDFGIARPVDSDAEMTTSGMVMGSPRYMSPEQATSEPVDHRSDLFSLGSVLYHLVSGTPPFDGKNVTATLMAVSLADEPPIAKQVSGLHSGLANLIGKLLQRDPASRPQSAKEVVDSLLEIEQSSVLDTVAGTSSWNRRGGRWWLIATAMGLVAVIAAGTTPWRRWIPPVPLQLELLRPVAVVSSTEEFDLNPASQLIDGSGFATPITLKNYHLMEHDEAIATNVWVTNDPGGWPSDYYESGPVPELTFDLGGAKMISQMAVWGYFIQGMNNNNEAKTMMVRFSSDGGATYHSEVAVEHQMTGTRVETIALGGPHLADTIQIQIIDNHFTTIDGVGGDRVGLSELRFIGYSDGDGGEDEPVLQSTRSEATTTPTVEELNEQWTQPLSLSETINVGSYNYSPWMSGDGLELWFVTNLGPTNGFDDLWSARRESLEEPWQAAEPVGPPINTDAHETEFAISRDKQEIFFSRSGVLLRASRQDDELPWSDPTPVGATEGMAVRSPIFSNDELKLYCGISFGPQADIYELTRSERGEPWSEPVQPIGNLSSNYLDWPNFISADGCRMLIESTRPGGLGNADLWVATRPTIDAAWGAPKHLPAPINSPKKDTAGWMAADGNTLMFGSACKGGKRLMDIYMSERISR